MLPAPSGAAGPVGKSFRDPASSAGGASASDDDGSDDDDGDFKAYTYMIQPPENKFIRLTPHVELMREVEVSRDCDSNSQGARNRQQHERKVTFVLRARTAERVDAFLRAAVHSYNNKLRAGRDKARYLHVPVLNTTGAPGAAAGTTSDGGDGSGNAASRALVYRRYRLGDHRTFACFFHPERDAILELVRSFTKKTGRFGMPGYPQKLGFLLHGPPGTGKTSFIKALAHLTGRHIVSIPQARVRTNADLMSIMHDEKIKLHGDDEHSLLPCNKVIFVLEDVDAASRVVRRRTPPTPANPNAAAATAHSAIEAAPKATTASSDAADAGDATPEPTTPPNDDAGVAATAPAATALETLLMCEAVMATAAKQRPVAANASIEVVGSGNGGAAAVAPDAPDANLRPASILQGLLLGREPARDDELNLAGLLNVLDGVVDTPERIVVLTTNHPEMLDPALVRPGRINRKVYLGHLHLREASLMVAHWFAADATAAEAQVRAAGWVDGVMTPAELECMCAEHDDIGRLLQALGAWFGALPGGKATAAPPGAAAAC